MTDVQGTTVTEPVVWKLLDPAVLAASVQHDDELVILDQLVGIRSALESRTAARAATTATGEELLALEVLLVRLDAESVQPELFTRTDVAFHDLIMGASYDGCATDIDGSWSSMALPSGSARNACRAVPIGTGVATAAPAPRSSATAASRSSTLRAKCWP